MAHFRHSVENNSIQFFILYELQGQLQKEYSVYTINYITDKQKQRYQPQGWKTTISTSHDIEDNKSKKNNTNERQVILKKEIKVIYNNGNSVKSFCFTC
jgi:hypothetical protein